MSQLKVWDSTANSGAGAWVNAVVGAQGATGAQGAQGAAATTGIVPISSGVITAVSGTFLTLDNIFTSTYRDYVFKFQITATSASGGVTLRYRRNGTTYSTAVYNDQQLSGTGTTTGSLATTNSTSQRLSYAQTTTAYPQFPIELKIYNPLSASIWTSSNHTVATTSGGVSMSIITAWHGSAGGGALAADGLELTVSTGTITANYQLYGVVNP